MVVMEVVRVGDAAVEVGVGLADHRAGEVLPGVAEQDGEQVSALQALRAARGVRPRQQARA